MRLCHSGLCHNKQAGCILVDAVHKPHLRVVGVEIGIILQVPGYGIYERTVSVATTRMHDKTRRFVHHHQVVVLIDHIERYIFGDYAVVIGRGIECDDNLVTRLHLVVALHHFAIHGNGTGIGSLLYFVA